MNTKEAIILIAFSLFISLSMSAQILKPAKWQYNLSKQDAIKGEIVELVFNIKLDANWHLYSNVQDYKLGPLPTVFEFELNDSYKLIDEVKAIGAKKEYDKVFEVDVNFFEHTAEFRQKIEILTNQPLIKGYYEYQVCSTIDGKCIIGVGDFEINVKTN